MSKKMTIAVMIKRNHFLIIFPVKLRLNAQKERIEQIGDRNVNLIVKHLVSRQQDAEGMFFYDKRMVFYIFFEI